MLKRLAHRHVQHVRDGRLVVRHSKHDFRVPLRVAHRARRQHVGEELHGHRGVALALARLAAPAGLVEGEVAGLEPADARRGGARERRADFVEEAGVGRSVGLWRAPNRALVDGDDFVDVFVAREGLIRGLLRHNKRFFFRRVVFKVGAGFLLELPLAHPVDQRGLQYEVHQGTLPTSADPCKNGHCSKLDCQIHALQVVALRSLELEKLPASWPTARWRIHHSHTREILARDRVLALEQILVPPFENDLAPKLSRQGSKIHHPIRPFDRRLVVFHHYYGVTVVPQPFERIEELSIVSRMQADRRLVEHIDNPRHRRPQSAREFDSPRLPTTQRPRRAVEPEISQSQVAKHPQTLLHLLERTFCDGQHLGVTLIGDAFLHDREPLESDRGVDARNLVP
mmetsp:Transcript_114/g.311  ORF Transcript_114/g.311 Transcript_114/m.311 type:complete len:398 (+) Transcript_114:974-2167(+)